MAALSSASSWVVMAERERSSADCPSITANTMMTSRGSATMRPRRLAIEWVGRAEVACSISVPWCAQGRFLGAAQRRLR
ncbi:hypothetical protein RZS08_55045, partial [Arthrospira platensis SPKY1]|nr:hypothetical protein [Arthrospira platensis SPKY1]